jgi:hypothetical protein
MLSFPAKSDWEETQLLTPTRFPSDFAFWCWSHEIKGKLGVILIDHCGFPFDQKIRVGHMT